MPKQPKKKRLSRSQRKFIRKEKARIRRDVLDIKEQEKLIAELYQVKEQSKDVEQTKKPAKKTKPAKKIKTAKKTKQKQKELDFHCAFS